MRLLRAGYPDECGGADEPKPFALERRGKQDAHRISAVRLAQPHGARGCCALQRDGGGMNTPSPPSPPIYP